VLLQALLKKEKEKENEKVFRDLGSELMGFIIYFIILFVLIYFWHKNSKAIDNLGINLPKRKKKRNEIYEHIEGKKLDSKILGWIIVVYICLGFFVIGGDGDECIPTYWYAC
tara:strand:+ start:116 stop:451 length:336 start_codon:yes stop_codon:yes gene_type:complete